MLHLSLMLNAFAIFGILFLCFAVGGIGFFETSQYVYDTWFLCIVSAVLYYVIFFLAFIYLKLIINHYVEFDIKLLENTILAFMLFSYLILIAKMTSHEILFFREFFGGVTILWLFTPLMILKALKRKFWLITCGLLLIETAVIYSMTKAAKSLDLGGLAFGTTVLVIVFFPVFLRLSNKINFEFQMGKPGTLLSLSLLFIPGAFLGFSYLLFY